MITKCSQFSENTPFQGFGRLPFLILIDVRIHVGSDLNVGLPQLGLGNFIFPVSLLINEAAVCRNIWNPLARGRMGIPSCLNTGYRTSLRNTSGSTGEPSSLWNK